MRLQVCEVHIPPSTGKGKLESTLKVPKLGIFFLGFREGIRFSIGKNIMAFFLLIHVDPLQLVKPMLNDLDIAEVVEVVPVLLPSK